MEVVHVFNKELKSILDNKLPVSRHKMSLITKSAMKALKFYKHVVQSVEKFISKCSCEYKVPGLYVTDAIVRQSKHQYCDKDVFVPRFMRNIVTTFIHLSRCDPKDLTSIERVLRLWQQNGVFPTDLVESLLELVYDANDNIKILNAGNIVFKLVNEWNILKGKPEEKLEIFLPHIDCVVGVDSLKAEGGLIDSITKLLTRFQAETGQDVTIEINQIQILHQKIVEQSVLLSQGAMIDSDTLSQLHQSMEELTKKAAKAAAVQQSKLAMLENDERDHINDASTDLEFVEQLQQMVDTLGQTRALQEELKQALESNENTQPNVNEEVIIVDKDSREFEEGEEACTNDINTDQNVTRLQNNPLSDTYNNHSDQRIINNQSSEKLSRTQSNGSRKRTHSSSDAGFKKRKTSESKEHKRKDKKNHTTRKRWMPLIREQFVGIISHTMFIGHLHKHVSETKLRTICEEYGSLAEFNMIPPRGCAFVTFDKRKGTYKAIAKMNELKFEGRDLKVAWAPNKGVKDAKEFREYWVESEGCTYIPFEQFPVNRSKELCDGFADLDVDSLTEEMKQAIYQFEQQKSEALARSLDQASKETMISLAAEVSNNKTPLLSPRENIVDTSTPYFSQFSIPPPMMPLPIIPFPPPPPPHLFLGTPPPPLHRPELSIPNYMDQHYPPPMTINDTAMIRVSEPPPSISVAPPPLTPLSRARNYLTRPSRPFYASSTFARNRHNYNPRPSLRYPRPPPPGFPVLRATRQTAPRFG